MEAKKAILGLLLIAAAAGAFGQEIDGKAYVSLFKAAEAGDAATVQSLIDKGLEVNALVSVGKDASHIYYKSLLGAAVLSGSTETVALLLERGADVNLNAPQGGLMPHPLYVAVNHNSVPLIKLLLEAGSGPASKRAALFFITKSEEWLGAGEPHVDRSAALRELIRQGADVDAEDEHGRTPLTYAIWRGHKEYAEILRRAGANEPPAELVIGTFVNDAATRAKFDLGGDSVDRDYTGVLYADEAATHPVAQFTYFIHAKRENEDGITEYLTRSIYAPNDIWCYRLRFSENGKVREIDSLGRNEMKFPKEINKNSMYYGVAHRL